MRGIALTAWSGARGTSTSSTSCAEQNLLRRAVVRRDRRDRAPDLARDDVIRVPGTHRRPHADVKRDHPELAGAVDAVFPCGQFNGKTARFWEQLEDTNFAALWGATRAR